MIVTGAFIAEHAEAVDNKLNVTGGIISRWKVGDDRIARLVIVVMTQAEPGSTDNNLTIDVYPPDVVSAEPLRIHNVELPQVTVNNEIGFAIFGLGISLPFNGRWRIVIEASGGSAALPLNVRGPNGR